MNENENLNTQNPEEVEQNTQNPEEVEQNTKNPEEIKVKKVVVSNCNSLNVRKSDTQKSPIICVINRGTKITITPIQGVDIDDDWAHIKLENGIEGYVMGKFIEEV